MRKSESTNKPLVVLLSTGLGRIARGYENHIEMLGDALLNEPELPFRLELLAGKSKPATAFKPIFNIHRNAPALLKLNLSWKKRFQIEQASFLIGMIPYLLIRKPDTLYMAEYELYCWLYKLRKYLRLSYGLILYTGGMAVPGLFDSKKDRVHHVTDEYVQTAIDMNIPLSNQYLIPHFIRTKFQYDDALMASIKQKANGKKIVLVVGAMNTNHKRMDIAAEILGSFPDAIYPIFLGDKTDESDFIESLLKKYFGQSYLLVSCNGNEVGTYYAVADLFFSASAYESFGIVYIEALWHGLTMFCHEHNTIRKIIGNESILCNINNKRDAVKALQISISELPDFATSCLTKHSFAKNRYGWDALTKQYINLFENF